jgi:hypothetical protein
MEQVVDHAQQGIDEIVELVPNRIQNVGCVGSCLSAGCHDDLPWPVFRTSLGRADRDLFLTVDFVSNPLKIGGKSSAVTFIGVSLTNSLAPVLACLAIFTRGRYMSGVLPDIAACVAANRTGLFGRAASF